MKKIKIVFWGGYARHYYRKNTRVIYVGDIMKGVKNFLAVGLYWLVKCIGVVIFVGCYVFAAFDFFGRWCVRRLIPTSSVNGLWLKAKLAHSVEELEFELRKHPKIPPDSPLSSSVDEEKTFFNRLYKDFRFSFKCTHSTPDVCIVKKWQEKDNIHVGTWLVPCDLRKFVFIK